jgi:hypothetical protein
MSSSLVLVSGVSLTLLAAFAVGQFLFLDRRVHYQ